MYITPFYLKGVNLTESDVFIFCKKILFPFKSLKLKTCLLFNTVSPFAIPPSLDNVLRDGFISSYSVLHSWRPADVSSLLNGTGYTYMYLNA